MIDETRIGKTEPFAPVSREETPERAQPPSSGEESFVHVLKDSIARVNSLQTEADKTIHEFSTGQDGVTLHQTMIEMAQADVSFHLMMQVRDRIVKAYQEMNNMPL